MHNVPIAEWILSLFVSRDRASSTAGDLAEQSASRGQVWFWAGVFRTAASLLYRGVADRPARMTGWALLGLVMYAGVTDFLHPFLSGIAFFAAASQTGHPPDLGSIGWQIWFVAPMLLAGLLVGRLMARWEPGREASLYVTYAALTVAYGLVQFMVFRALPTSYFYAGGGAAPRLDWLAFAASQLPVLAGAAWGRRRRLASA
jgi:hypothetical protein